MLLLIDNYDSFTYNLYHQIASKQAQCQVHRNNKLTLNQALKLKPNAIIISPGPKTPTQAGISLPIVKACAENNIALFGVCLGMQCIAQAYGGKIIPHTPVHHGKTSTIKHNNDPMFKNVPTKFSAVRYHSLIVESDSLPPELQATSTSDDDNVIMSLRHKQLPIFGVQFHPESIAAEYGSVILDNFLQSVLEQ